MKTEFGEVEEPVPPGTVGSSTMPQKRNPKLCQDIIAAAAEIRSIVPFALEAMQTEHEADRTTSLMMDFRRFARLHRHRRHAEPASRVFRGLKLDPVRMRANLDLGGGLIMAEAVMLDLGAAIGRQHAHDVVYDAAMEAAVENKSFGDLLAADQRVTAHLDPGAIKKLLDPTAYTGLCAEMARDAAVRARATAKGIRGRLSYFSCHSGAACTANPERQGKLPQRLDDGVDHRAHMKIVGRGDGDRAARGLDRRGDDRADRGEPGLGEPLGQCLLAIMGARHLAQPAQLRRAGEGDQVDRPCRHLTDQRDHLRFLGSRGIGVGHDRIDRGAGLAEKNRQLVRRVGVKLHGDPPPGEIFLRQRGNDPGGGRRLDRQVGLQPQFAQPPRRFRAVGDLAHPRAPPQISPPIRPGRRACQAAAAPRR